MRPSLKFASAGAAAVTLLAFGAASAGGMIATRSGPVAGTRLDSGVKAYLGIPFAKPPTQDLRWKPPQPIAWKGVWNADRTGPECMQVLRPHNINHYFGEEPTSEDCLYLNVWTPGGAKPGARLPVIVFIYGGGNTIGSSGMANYAGDAVAARGAVFVNFNYRVGVLGFLAHPELSREQGGHSGNYAYLDQNAALRWVHDNIAQFGGDPSKVVVMGQSAGAGGVIAQLFSPLSKGLFRAGVMSSGCNFTSDAPTLAEGEQNGLAIQKRLGAASLDDMRQIPADKIIAAQAESQVGANTQGVRAGPVIDGYFAPKSKLATLQAREFNDVPIIASSNHEDLDFNSSPLTKARTVAEYTAVAAKLYGADAPAFLRLYPVTTDADVPVMAGEAAREGGMGAAGRACAALQARYNRSAAYIDLYSHRHPYAPGVKIADQNTATAGAYHTADMPYWYGTLDKYNMIRPTRAWQPWDRTLSDEMMDTLVALANTGSPSTPAVPWPAWSAANEQKVEFGDSIKVVKLNTQHMDWLAAHPAAPVAPNGPQRTGPRD
jgi:para-nitrobenzyl esterase